MSHQIKLRRVDLVSQDVVLSRDPPADPELAPYLERGVAQCASVSMCGSAICCIVHNQYLERIRNIHTVSFNPCLSRRELVQKSPNIAHAVLPAMYAAATNELHLLFC